MSSGTDALPKAPPKEYGWCAQTSKCTLALHVECGCDPFEMQSIDRMKASG